MKKNKILLSIVLCLVAFASMFTMFIPKTKVSAYTGYGDSSRFRSTIPIDVITYSSLGVDNQVLSIPTIFLNPDLNGSVGNLSTVNSINNAPDVTDLNCETIFYYYDSPQYGLYTGNPYRIQQYVRVYGSTNTYRSLNLGLTSHDFIYWRTATDNSNCFLIPQFNCNYTLMLSYILPNGELGSHSTTGFISNGDVLDIKSFMLDGIPATVRNLEGELFNVDYVYIKVFRILLTRSGASAFSQQTVSLYSSSNWIDESNLNIGQSFIDDINDMATDTVTVYEIDWFENIVQSIDRLLSIEILPEISFYDILIVCICIPLLVGILKAWLGG